YVRNEDERPVYFDDLEIFRSSSLDESKFSKADELQLHIDSLDLAKMDLLRTQAVAMGFLDENTKEEFIATIEFEGALVGAKTRFKGDWTDHLSTSKLSYRIALSGKAKFKGMGEFSIQHPKTRDYMNEWFVHKLFEAEGVLTTPYHFIPVRVNGSLKGAYAMEGHFTEDLLKLQDRKPGPILKFDESLFWKRLKSKT
ncbi:MAG: hypothetical protein GY915_02105, partial [bacterium]|nr:hypothetical protein [bacterium]